MKDQKQLRELIKALNGVIDIARKMLGANNEKNPQDLIAEYLADLAQDREIGPLREWFKELKRKTVIVLVDKKGVRSQELSEILGLSPI